MIFGALMLGAMFSVIHSSDGGVDDFATTALIAAAQERNKEENSFDFPAIIITNADCEPISTLSAYLKTTKLLNMKTQVGLSSSRVWTQFPWQWRIHSTAINQIPCLQSEPIHHDLISFLDGDDLLIEQHEKS